MHKRLVILVPALIAIALLVGACDEEEVPFVIDDEEIIRYIESAEDAQDLFRVEGLYPEEPFEVPFDNAVWMNVIDSTRRMIEVDAHVDTLRLIPGVGWGHEVHIFPSPLGEQWHADVAVDDFFYGRTLRIDGADTSEVPFTRVLSRYGFFLKLGSDNQDYFGWKLWGFNGGGPTNGTFVIRTDDDTSFRGDLAGYDEFDYQSYSVVNGVVTDSSRGNSLYSYKRLDQLPTLTDGVELYLDASSVSENSQVRLVSAHTDSGYELFNMDRASSTQYVDTIATRNNTDELWNLLAVQELIRTRIPGSDPPMYTTQWYTWVVPYRIPQ